MKVGRKMFGSLGATIYMIFLGVFFLALVVMTILIIVKKSKLNSEEEMDDFDKDSQGDTGEEDEGDNADGSDHISVVAAKESDLFVEDSAFENIPKSEAEDIEKEIAKLEEIKMVSEDLGETAEVAMTEEAPEVAKATEFTETRTETVSEAAAQVQAVEEATDSQEVAEAESTSENKEAPHEAEPANEEVLASLSGIEDIPEDSAFSANNDYEDSDDNLDYTTGLGTIAGVASMAEVAAMTEAAMAVNEFESAIETGKIFKAKKKNDKKSSDKKSFVPANEEFYWYNVMDVAEMPSYKTKDMYYHYFNIPADCIEDLLIEMYDCGLVRTEEIKCIAYGIVPKAVSMKEILTSGNGNYNQQQKIKEPSTQDLVRIYEKWCGYVEQLFEKIEIYADDYTISAIRKELYEYGKNDPDVLIEGK